MPQATSSIVVDVPPKSLYEVAIDFESYPDFLPDVKFAKIKKRQGNNLIVDFEISVIKTIRYTLKVAGTPGKKIRWSLVEGDFFKKNEGGWMFEDLKGKTRGTYTIDIDFGLFVPSLITSRLIGANLPAMMKRFKERAEGLA